MHEDTATVTELVTAMRRGALDSMPSWPRWASAPRYRRPNTVPGWKRCGRCNASTCSTMPP